MFEPRLLRRLQLGPNHRATERTRHYIAGRLAPPPAELRIVRYEGGPGCYLFSCDASGVEITDTWHRSLEEALSQSAWEHNVEADAWEIVQA